MISIANPAVIAASQGYRRLLARRCCLLLVMGCALVGAVLLDLSTGSSGMGLGDLIQGLLHPQTLDVTDRVIIWNVRLPYALMAVMVGAALSLAGAEMQAILNNPLASPFTLGVSSAAALGASLVIEVLEWPTPKVSYSLSERRGKAATPSFWRKVAICSRRPVRILCGYA